ncbi:MULTISPECIES: 3-methyl-2-oxobutanoate hydroxymethyltransferase [unclassified Rhizobium]|uniref:3-methyl-2-oxobutanoate hydroxymethyltransferase n=1 Tax=unclassified Rhizobium TaxID=2613769 RepID=UPI001ADC58A4|nr:MULTISPECIES: 3-methyl-2-oxobutanoate hydroxymethyltransferase [unclassified Rhizobium]MBO9127386.1 3-methyl-2-oxobutanoate hydroxymethyltransferase [Rhizobium sp. 16-488-2b]MBO9177829.1 3-methyl-2-oxobutanoate hydroxymethyltransferase [Rhizobium sp. 16-488-2a]
MTRALTVADLRALKGKRQFLTMHVDSPAEAAAATEAGIEMFTCEVDEQLPRIRKAAPTAFIQAAHVQGAIHDESSAIREGFRALDLGASCIYFAGSLRLLEAMAKEGIPVSGHVGLVPRWATWTNFRAIGTTPEEAASIYRRVKDYEQAGAWAVEMEVVPVAIAEWITRSTPLITLGMGCGAVCDSQYLFSCDVLGTGTSRVPRHAKQYADLAAAEARLQDLRVNAFRAFAEDVRDRKYPETRHEVHVGEEVLAAAKTLV